MATLSQIAAEDQYAARRRDEDELIAAYPGLDQATDEQLIDLAGDADADELAAAAAILLDRRLAAMAA